MGEGLERLKEAVRPKPFRYLKTTSCLTLMNIVEEGVAGERYSSARDVSLSQPLPPYRELMK